MQDGLADICVACMRANGCMGAQLAGGVGGGSEDLDSGGSICPLMCTSTGAMEHRGRIGWQKQFNNAMRCCLDGLGGGLRPDVGVGLWS